MKIIQANSLQLDQATQLFDAYRVFYGKNSDLQGAKNFIQERLQKRDSVLFLVADDELTGVGFAQLYPSFTSIGMGKVFILNDLYVDSDHRKKGIATKLLEHIKEFAQKNDAVKINLQTECSNSAAQKLYESQGYKQEKDFLNFYLSIAK